VQLFLLFFLLCCCIHTFDCYQLKKVILITRHGDRTPMRSYPNTYKWDDYGQLTGEGMNQLYNLGLSMRQHYVVDLKFISEKYVRNEVYARATDKDRTLQSAQSFLMGLYPPGTGSLTADNSEEWYSDLYPGYHVEFNDKKEAALPNFQTVIPIHTTEKKNDLLLHQYKNCPKLGKMRKVFKNSEEWKKKRERSSANFGETGQNSRCGIDKIK